MDVPLIFNLGWNGFGSNFTGWDGIGAENLPREDLYFQRIHNANTPLMGLAGLYIAIRTGSVMLIDY